MWRINGLSAACLLVLGCALLFTNEVKCDDGTSAPTAEPGTTAAGGEADTGAADTGAADTGAADTGTADTGAADTGAADTGAADTGAADTGAADTGAADTGAADTGDTVTHLFVPPGTGSTIPEAPVVEMTLTENPPAPVLPEVKCIGKEDITESKAVKASVNTNACEDTKKFLESVPANWCSKAACKINVHQDGTTVLLDSEDASGDALASALQSEGLKTQLGVTDVKYTPSNSSSVFVGILVTGLLAAVALTVGYFKCQRRPSPKGERLAEEGTPVDQQNQANTLASDAPLNPPPETPEKPSANGDAPEGDKTQPPPTNGHSTPANTADTEL